MTDMTILILGYSTRQMLGNGDPGVLDTLLFIVIIYWWSMMLSDGK